jgi:hypothetical protein
MGAKGLPGAIRKLLPSLVRILLRNGMAAKSFYDMAKETYVTVAHDEFGTAECRSIQSCGSRDHRMATRPG